MRLCFFALLFVLHAVAAATQNANSTSTPAHCNKTYTTAQDPAFRLHKRGVRLQDPVAFQAAVSLFLQCERRPLRPGPGGALNNGPYHARYEGRPALLKLFPHPTKEAVGEVVLRLQAVNQLFAWGYHGGHRSQDYKSFYVFMPNVGERFEVVRAKDPGFFDDMERVVRIQDDAIRRYFWQFNVVNRNMRTRLFIGRKTGSGRRR